VSSRVTTSRLSGFDDPRLGREAWNTLLHRGSSNVVFLTWEWQRAWWESFDRSGLMLVLAENDGEPVALAPFFEEEGLIYFVGSGGSDYLDFIGDVRGEGVLEALIAAAIEEASSFRGLRLYHVPEHSTMGERLRGAAVSLGLAVEDEIGMSAPALDLTSDAGQAALKKKSLLRHENFFRREGGLEILHFRSADDVAARLEAFFAQHIERWSGTPFPSLFHENQQKDFYRALTRWGAVGGWLRFTEVRWRGASIAFHFGSSYAGTFLWYKPSFDLALARHSPGEVLLRQLLLAALEEKAHTFDFGLGDEAFKERFATETNRVRNWSLSPS